MNVDEIVKNECIKIYDKVNKKMLLLNPKLILFPELPNILLFLNPKEILLFPFWLLNIELFPLLEKIFILLLLLEFRNEKGELLLLLLFNVFMNGLLFEELIWLLLLFEKIFLELKLLLLKILFLLLSFEFVKKGLFVLLLLFFDKKGFPPLLLLKLVLVLLLLLWEKEKLRLLLLEEEDKKGLLLLLFWVWNLLLLTEFEFINGFRELLDKDWLFFDKKGLLLEKFELDLLFWTDKKGFVLFCVFNDGILKGL